MGKRRLMKSGIFTQSPGDSRERRGLHRPRGDAGRRAASALKALGTALSVTLILTGCVSPYVTRPVAEPGNNERAVSLPGALAYARETRESYRAKIIELGESERNLSNSLVTLGGALIAAGAFGAHRDTLVGGALIGGTAYSLGTFNTDKRRAVIYVAGMKALTCSEHAVSALNFDDKVATRLKENIASITVRLTRVTTAIAKVERLVEKSAADAAKSAQTETQSARLALARAISAQGAADQLIAQRSIAGGRLRTAVDDIDTIILDAIRGTEGALEAVPQIIGGLVKSSQVFAPQVNLADVIKTVPIAHAKIATTDKATAAELDAAIASLKGEVVLLDSEAQRLTSLVATFDAAKAIDALKSCRIEGLPAAMKVDSAELKFKAKTADKKTVVVEGGKTPYYSYIEGSPPGLSVENPQSQVLIVSATDQVAVGNYRLIVQDNTRQTRLVVAIEVAEAAKNGDAASTGNPSDDLVNDINKKGVITVAGVEVKLKAEKQPTGGKVEVTYTALAGSTVTDDEVMKELEKEFEVGRRIGAGNLIVSPATAHGRIMRSRTRTFTDSLSRDDVRIVQKQICLTGKDLDGRWGPTTQGALNAYRAKRREAGSTDVARGALTHAEFVQLSDDAKAGKTSVKCP